jgi:exosortase A-associated hydrolase 2
VTPPPEAFFLDAGPGRHGQRFCLYHASARAPASGIVVQVHAFAEEMNKSRHMAALQSRAFAEHGFAVLQIDLLGCGDSSADFGDATWDDWVVDVCLAVGWLRERVAAPLWLWGIRAGALIACDAAARIDTPCNFVFWQPALAGKSVLQQFLRLKAAANLGDGQMKTVLDETRARLDEGQGVEIAGYLLAPRLADGLKQTSLQPPLRPGSVAWLEVSSRETATLNPAALEAVARWRAAGHDVRAQVVPGPMFWQTVEIEVAPALLDASSAAMSGATTR